jgi:hypothetical protein
MSVLFPVWAGQWELEAGASNSRGAKALRGSASAQPRRQRIRQFAQGRRVTDARVSVPAEASFDGLSLGTKLVRGADLLPEQTRSRDGRARRKRNRVASLERSWLRKRPKDIEHKSGKLSQRGTNALLSLALWERYFR